MEDTDDNFEKNMVDDKYENSRERRIKGIICIHLGCLLFIIVQALTKICTNNGVHVIDFSFIRIFANFIGAIFTVTFSGKHIIKHVTVRHFKVIFVRSICGIVGFSLLVFSIKTLPTFIVNIIWNILPFWVSILGYMILSENVGPLEILCMIGSFIGIVILALTKQHVQHHTPQQTSDVGKDS